MYKDQNALYLAIAGDIGNSVGSSCSTQRVGLKEVPKAREGYWRWSKVTGCDKAQWRSAKHGGKWGWKQFKGISWGIQLIKSFLDNGHGGSRWDTDAFSKMLPKLIEFSWKTCKTHRCSKRWGEGEIRESKRKKSNLPTHAPKKGGVTTLKWWPNFTKQ